jgi:ABC-type hemin transport system substrate-binding protein
MYEASAGVEVLDATGDLDGVAALLEYVAQAAKDGAHGEGLLRNSDQEVGHQQRHVLQIGQYGKRQLAHFLFL